MMFKRKKKQNKHSESENEEQPRRSGNREVMVITYLFIAVFAGLIINMVCFMVMDSKEVINNSYNQRQTLLAKRVVRGKILGSEGEVLAETKTDALGNDTRKYPYGRMFTHVVGHSTEGKTGIELSENFNLLTSNDNPLTNIELRLAGEKTIGDNVITTLDVDLQKVAYEALGNYRGAVIVSEPSTGKILAMVSKPDYDPNPSSLNVNWDSLIADTDNTSCLVNRATQGLYPPGSTFKILTALEYIRENSNYKRFTYDCHGTENQEGYVVNCYRNHVHGHLDLKTAFAKSCNSCFASIGTRLDINQYYKTCESMLFQQKLPTSIVHNKSSFVLNEESGKEEVMHTAMGQGKTQITPLHASMIVSAIANEGVLMENYVVDYLESNNGNVVRQTEQKEYGTLMTKEEASILTDMMKEVTKTGTASSLGSLSYPVAGKTGSAEYDSTKNSHAWFWGFAPADNPKIAVTVIVEGAGTGSQYAVPIVKKILQSYLGN